MSQGPPRKQKRTIHPDGEIHLPFPLPEGLKRPPKEPQQGAAIFTNDFRQELNAGLDHLLVAGHLLGEKNAFERYEPEKEKVPGPGFFENGEMVDPPEICTQEQINEGVVIDLGVVSLGKPPEDCEWAKKTCSFCGKVSDHPMLYKSAPTNEKQLEFVICGGKACMQELGRKLNEQNQFPFVGSEGTDSSE